MTDDNPDLVAIAGDDTVTVRRAALAALFDLAVNSLDFGSDFWDTADTLVAREIAEALGVCPTVATPRSHRPNYPVCEGLRPGIEACRKAEAERRARWPGPDFLAPLLATEDSLIRTATHADHEVTP